MDSFKLATQFVGLGVATLTELTQRLLFDLAAIQQKSEPVHFAWLAPQMSWAQKKPLQTFMTMQPYLFGVQRSASHPLNSMLVIESLLNRWRQMAHGD